MSEDGTGSPGEFEIIAEIFAPLAGNFPGAFELTDDAALLEPPPGQDLVLTKDMLAEGVHFLPDTPADLVARKLMRVNLSDLAAMGAKPLGYMLGIALAAEIDTDWLRLFAAGLAEDQAAFGISLMGGDTVAAPNSVFSLTAVGQVAKGRALRRKGARIGDRLFVSGNIGDGILGLMAARGELGSLADNHRRELMARYQLPDPRLDFGQRVAPVARSGIDVSDGLVADLEHMCRASGVSAIVQAESVPLSDAARAALDADAGINLAALLSGGDDYELLFAVGENDVAPVRALAQLSDVRLSEIGVMGEGAGVRVLDRDGASMPMKSKGYTHR